MSAHQMKTVVQCGVLQDDLALQKQFYISGTHYSRTLEEWLLRMDAHRARIFPLFQVRLLSFVAQKGPIFGGHWQA